jgi:hypothetical protein
MCVFTPWFPDEYALSSGKKLIMLVMVETDVVYEGYVAEVTLVHGRGSGPASGIGHRASGIGHRASGIGPGIMPGSG